MNIIRDSLALFILLMPGLVLVRLFTGCMIAVLLVRHFQELYIFAVAPTVALTLFILVDHIRLV